MTAELRHLIATHVSTEVHTDTYRQHGMFCLMIPVTVIEIMLSFLRVMLIRLLLQFRRIHSTHDVVPIAPDVLPDLCWLVSPASRLKTSYVNNEVRTSANLLSYFGWRP